MSRRLHRPWDQQTQPAGESQNLGVGSNKKKNFQVEKNNVKIKIYFIQTGNSELNYQ